MSKLILKIATLLAVVSFSSAAFASQTFSSTTLGGLTFNSSNHVQINAASDPNNGYSAVSGHSSGTRYFGTDSAASIIYWQDATGTMNVSGQTVTVPANPGEHAASPDFTTWNSM